MNFAFLIHSRDYMDVHRKFKFAKFFPKCCINFWCKHWPPIIVSKITGLKSVGWVIGIPMTARQIIENKELARKKIIKAINKAEKLGAKIVGLGALTSSVTYGGEDIKNEINIKVTPGHAYTIYTVSNYVLKSIETFSLDKEKVVLGIVGAAGSIGSGCANYLASKGIRKFLLIDLERKNENLEKLVNKLKNLKNNLEINISHQIKNLKTTDIIIAATNTPEALIKPSDLKHGAIIVDDAQPSDISEEVLKQRDDDVLIIDGGVSTLSKINTHFNFGLADQTNVFSCLGEIVTLAEMEKLPYYKIGELKISDIDYMEKISRSVGLKIGEFQRDGKIIQADKIEKIKKIWTSKIS